MINFNEKQGVVILSYDEILDHAAVPYFSHVPKNLKWVNDEANNRFVFFVPIRTMTFDNGL
jgi:hypothetical protein